jgi:hypothetical protein
MFLQGWALSGIISYQSGFPYSATMPSGTDLNLDGNRRNDRAPGFARNSFYTEDQLSIDPRLTKAFSVFGDVRVQLIAEVFNITNESNVTTVLTNYYSLTNNQLVPLSNFGNPTAVTGAAGSGPRTIQLAAKISF